MPNRIPAYVLGGGGYVGAEFVRLLIGHPNFEIAAVASNTQSGERVDAAFPHLSGLVGELRFTPLDEVVLQAGLAGQAAVFCALPHGEARCVLEPLSTKPDIHIVDTSTDFREATARKKGALNSPFDFGLPDLTPSTSHQHVAHPGCFATGVSLACAPLVQLGLVQNPRITAFAVTGSTGSGRQPKPGTHHPDRHGGLWAYEPLKHRHTPEIEYLAGAGKRLDLSFVPHSGPFARGIHSTIVADLQPGSDPEAILKLISEFYKDSPFIRLSNKLPSVKDVEGSNRCHLGVAIEGDKIVVTSVIDNLVKGAAGGAIQWMNRLFDLPQEAGLMTPAWGWA